MAVAGYGLVCEPLFQGSRFNRKPWSLTTQDLRLVNCEGRTQEKPFGSYKARGLDLNSRFNLTACSTPSVKLNTVKALSVSFHICARKHRKWHPSAALAGAVWPVAAAKWRAVTAPLRASVRHATEYRWGGVGGLVV